MNKTDLAYRTSAAAGAGGFGLLIALYDTLAGDLRRAAEAQRAYDIERRSRDASHALLVTGHLENWLARGTAGGLGRKLAAFYAKLRHDILEAQIQQSADLLEEQMRIVLRIRALWQELEEAGHRQTEASPSPLPCQDTIVGVQSNWEANSWSA